MVMAATGAFVGFAVFGLFTSLAPSFVAVTLHHPSRLLAGVVPFIVFGAAALAQTATGRLANHARVLAGIGFQAIGLVVVAIAMQDANLASFLVGGALAGVGAGVLFKSALAAYVGLAEPARRGGGRASSPFLFAYLGLIVPGSGIGASTLSNSERPDCHAALHRCPAGHHGRHRRPRPSAIGRTQITGSSGPWSLLPAPAGTGGKLIVIASPPSFRLVTSTSAPWDEATACTIERPSPTPSPRPVRSRAIRWNGWNRRCTCACGTCGPVSRLTGPPAQPWSSRKP